MTEWGLSFPAERSDPNRGVEPTRIMDQGFDLDRKKRGIDCHSAPSLSDSNLSRYFTPERYHMQTRGISGEAFSRRGLVHAWTKPHRLQQSAEKVE